MPFYLRFFILISAFTFFGHGVNAQSIEDRIRSNALFAEKIYLQLDKKVYTTNHDIWYKAIVCSAANNTPTILSGVLYVELISPNEEIVEKKLVRIDNGIGNNFFELKDDYEAGKYQVRAYTEWNKNFDPDFTFQTYIDVFKTSNAIGINPIKNVNLVEKNQDEFWIQGVFKPEIIDSLQERQLPVYLSFEEKKDSILIKRKDGNFFLDYPVSKNTDLATITIRTTNGKKYSETFALKSKKPDLQFFPEGGELVKGLLNRVAFKAVNYAGKGLPVEGEIFDSESKVVQKFKSNDLGMGEFSLILDSAPYYARITSPAQHEESQNRYDLPKALGNGEVFSVIKQKNLIRLTIFSNYRKNDSVFIEVSSRGLAHYMFKGKKKEGVFNTTIESDTLPAGILAFTLFNQYKKPVGERIVFNDKTKGQLKIKLETDKSFYNQRDETGVRIKILDDKGEPVKANTSLLVVSKDEYGNEKKNNQNILSYFLVDSELKGEIEKPGYYFNTDNKDRLRDLDLLMLTQGWRKYNYQNSTKDRMKFQPEKTLNLSGVVYNGFSKNKRVENGNLTLITFGGSKSVYSQNTDSLGLFNFSLYDEFGGGMEILIQSQNKSGKNRNFDISLNKKQEPKISFDHWRTISPPDSTVFRIVDREREREIYEESFESLEGVTQLDEVLLEGKEMTPQRQKVTDRYGKPDTIIEGELIQEKEKNWSYGLYSVLLFNFPDKIRIRRNSEGFMEAQVTNGESNLVVIDGIPVKGYSYNLIPLISPSEVKSFEIIEYAKNFRSLFMFTYPEVHPTEVPKVGNVISIYTHSGNGLYSVEKPKGILRTEIPVFAVTKEFYQPRYNDISVKRSRKPDLRSVVHWDPEIITDASGDTVVSYFNSDVSGDMLIIVEAIDEKGRVGYQTLTYKVENN